LIRIRFARVGKKKQPSYRLVVATKEAPRDGRFIEILGHYNPLKNPSELEFNADRTREWIAKGAQPSEAVAKLLAREGIGEAPKRPTKPRKEEQKAAPREEKPAAPAEAAAPEAAEARDEAPAAESTAETAEDDESAEAAEEAVSETDDTAAQAEADAEAPEASADEPATT
jgi:small subunit ribosomal protein S16